MDEVKTMTQAGESVGKAVGTGLRTIRRNAVRAGQAGAEQAAKAAAAAEHKLAEQTSALVDNVEAARDELVGNSRRARRKLARNAKKTAHRTAKRAGKKLDDQSDKARKAGRKTGRKANKKAADAGVQFNRKVRKKLTKLEGKTAKLRSKAERNPRGRGRRWVWLLGAGGLAAVAVVVVKSRQSAPEPTAPVIPLGGDASTNGVVPREATPVSEHKK
ncbi:MAG TPA: hypothetical protein VHX38_36745 [Pseudonocardiaceae bacterium]|jgi:hypothetical protein|nr:hypothetical protein [Pseudonocardiaceae bacterium]